MELVINAIGNTLVAGYAAITADSLNPAQPVHSPAMRIGCAVVQLLFVAGVTQAVTQAMYTPYSGRETWAMFPAVFVASALCTNPAQTFSEIDVKSLILQTLHISNE